jgi:hypothetical protein
MAGAAAAAVPSHEGALAAYTRAERTGVTRGAPGRRRRPVAPGWRPLLRTRTWREPMFEVRWVPTGTHSLQTYLTPFGPRTASSRPACRRPGRWPPHCAGNWVCGQGLREMFVNHAPVRPPPSGVAGQVPRKAEHVLLRPGAGAIWPCIPATQVFVFVDAQNGTSVATDTGRP